MSRIKIVRDEEFGNNLVSLCIQCAEEYCVESCPLDAISRDSNTGVVLVDENSCNGCEACIVACPIGGFSYNKEKQVVLKCDLCGGDPKCVEFCSRGALTVNDTEIASPERKSFMEATGKLLSQV
ncbi:4Fe-4S dicluster domain-containing protein [Chloroflexota bacterium]